MKIVYSPYFGSRPYIDLSGRNGILFSAKTVGSAGLLDELELRFGLKGADRSGAERIVAYVKAMRAALSRDGGLFFAESFRGDEVGTAKVLLGWRDALKMALWKGEADGSERLRGLASVESCLAGGLQGPADRWTALHGLLSEGDPIPVPDMEIECRVPAESLPKVIRKTLALLPRAGVAVSFVTEMSPSAPEGTALRRVQEILLGTSVPSGDKAKLPNDKSVVHMDLRYGMDAFRMVAGGFKPMDGTLLVVDDSARFDDALTALDRPRVAASASGVPQTEQLFLLGLSLFRSPVDLNSLTSYLRVPANPLEELCVRKEKKDGTPYWRAVNRELLDSILEKGGLEQWETILGEALYDKDGEVLSARKRNAILSRIGMWDRVNADGSIPVGTLSAWLDNIRKWAAGHKDDGGFAALASCCAALGALLEGYSGSVDRGKVVKWASALVEEIMMDSTAAEERSFDSVGDMRNVADAPDKVVWLGCVGKDETQYPYDFLSEGEKAFLGVPTKEQVADFAHRALCLSIASIRESLTLITYEILDGAPVGEHPLMIELGAVAELPKAEDEDFPVMPEMRGTAVKPGDPQLEYRVDSFVFEKRDRESASSVDTLIQHPFDYVMKYLLGMKPYGEAELQDVTTVRGTVAHLYVHRLIERSEKELAKMAALHASDFDPMVLECVKDRGAVLLLPENGLLYSGFKGALRESVSRLLDLLGRDRLAIVGSELEIKTDLPVIGPALAYIDLLLKDTAGNYVIVDMKWNDSSTYYKKVESGNVLQLAFYREAVCRHLGGRVSAMGYWVFPKCQLVTMDGDRFAAHPDVVSYPDTGRNVFAETCASYKFRMEQLGDGIIEEGECMPLADLDYCKRQDALGLYPLEEINNDGLKHRPYGNTYLTLKGGLN